MCSGDMATQYERVLNVVKGAVGQTKPIQSDRYVVGDWNLLQDPIGTCGHRCVCVKNAELCLRSIGILHVFHYCDITLC